MFSPLRSGIHCALRAKAWRRDYPGAEWFDVVTPRGRVLGRAPRPVCHGGPKLLHGVVHLHLFDARGRLYLQKRSRSKDIQPGRWDSSVGGHIDSGETVGEALVREAREELGILGFRPEFLKTYVWTSDREAELVHSHRTVWTGEEPRFDPGEIDEGRWWEPAEIEAALEGGAFTPNFRWEWEHLLRNL